MSKALSLMTVDEAYRMWEGGEGGLRDVVVVRVPWDVVVGDVVVVHMVDRWGRWSEREVGMGIVTNSVGERVRVGWDGSGRPGLMVIEGVG